MTHVRSFPPVANARARLLILGSMPGAASLEASRYYAHPRNAFWPIMGALIGAGPERPYRERLRLLKAHGIALWDVLQSCHRPGSLDSAIDDESLQPNDLAGFLHRHPHIQRIYFNGSKAEQVFRRWILPELHGSGAAIRRMRLPSTSPAHAARSFEQKLEAWRAILSEP